MNKKLTLGLLVFFVGVLMAACGDDNSTSNTVTTNTIPKTFEVFDYGCRSCDKSFSGRFIVTDRQAFEEAFDKSQAFGFGSDRGFDIDTRSNGFIGTGLLIFDDLLFGAADLAGAVLFCRGREFVSERIAERNGFDVENDCEIRDALNGGVDEDDLTSSYRSRAELRINADNRVTEITLQINSDVDYDDGTDELTFLDTTNVNVFENTRERLALRNRSGRLEIINDNGERVGYFRK